MNKNILFLIFILHAVVCVSQIDKVSSAEEINLILRETRSGFLKNDSILIFCGEQGWLIEVNQTTLDTKKIYQTFEPVDFIKGNKDVCVISTQEKIIIIDYNGIVFFDLPLEGMVNSVLFVNSNVFICTENNCISINYKSKNVFRYKFEKELSCAAVSDWNIFLGYTDGSIEKRNAETFKIQKKIVANSSSILSLYSWKEGVISTSENSINWWDKSLQFEGRSETLNLKGKSYMHKNHIYFHNYNRTLISYDLSLKEKNIFFLDSVKYPEVKKKNDEVSTSGSFKKYDFTTQTFDSIIFPHPVVDFDISFDENNSILGTRNGNIFFIDPSKMTIERQTLNKFYEKLTIAKLHEDFYVLGGENGVHGIYNLENDYIHFEYHGGILGSYLEGEICSVKKEKTLVLSSSSGLNGGSYLKIIDFSFSKKHKKKIISVKNANENIFHEDIEAISHMAVLNEGDVAALVKNNEILFYDFRNKVLLFKEIINFNITSLYFDKSGVLWIGTKGGKIISYSFSDRKWSDFLNTSHNSPIIAISNSSTSDTIITGSSNGIEVMDKNGQLLVKFTEKNINKVIWAPKSSAFFYSTGIILEKSKNIPSQFSETEYEYIREVICSEIATYLIMNSGKIYSKLKEENKYERWVIY